MSLKDIDAIFTKALEDCYNQEGNKLELRRALLDLSSNYGQVYHWLSECFSEPERIGAIGQVMRNIQAIDSFSSTLAYMIMNNEETAKYIFRVAFIPLYDQLASDNTYFLDEHLQGYI